MTTLPKIDIILQGPLDNYAIEIANHYSKLNFVDIVYLSCWDDDVMRFDETDRIKVVRSQQPSNPGMLNRNRQIISSLNGLLKTSKEFSIKLRNDQKIELYSMEMMYNYYFENNRIENNYSAKNKIGITSYYPPFPFHPRDHVFFGNTQDLIKFFSIPLDEDTFLGSYADWHHNTRPEAYIAMWYFARFDGEVFEMVKNKNNYICDNSQFHTMAQQKSQQMMETLFVTFPKIDLDWPEKNIYKNYPYDITTEVWKF